MRVAGIDPGLSGAVAVIDGDDVEIHDLPTLQVGRGRGRDYNVPALVDLIRGLRADVVYVERQQARPESAAVSYKVGYGLGLILGILSTLGIRHVVVWPQTWQAAMFHGGVPAAGKDRSMVVAQRLWPNLRLRRHDHADALLLAEYGRRCSQWRELE